MLQDISARGAVLGTLACCCVLLSLTLMRTSANGAANRWLAALLIVVAGVDAAYTVQLSRLDRTHAWLEYLPVSIPLALGPLIYSYVVHLTTGSLLRRLWLHFAPAGLQVIYVCSFYLLPRHLQDLLDDGRGRDLVRVALQWALIASLSTYAALALRQVARYRRWIENARSDADAYAGKWVRNVLYVLLALLLGEAAIRLQAWDGRRLSAFDTFPFYIGMTILVGYLGVEGRRFAERRFPPIQIVASVSATPEAQARTSRDWCSQGEAWRDDIAAQGWFRDPALSLADAARKLGTNTAYLSRAFNEGLRMNFSEVVNQLRAAAVAEALRADPAGQQDLLELALDAGFSSKATFNRAFRSLHGMTPTEMRVRLRLTS